MKKKRVNILLTNKLHHNHCSFCFIYPLILFRNELRESGFDFEFHYKFSNDLENCDCLLVDSAFYGKKWINNKDEIKKQLFNLKKNKKIIYVDNQDNSGLIKSELLDIVDYYWKGQTLKNKSDYKKKHYGGRTFTDFYYRENKIIDKKPIWSDVVKNNSDLNKIKTSWNMGYCNYGLFGHFFQRSFSLSKLSLFIRYPDDFSKNKHNKLKDFSCRIGTEYNRETISYQRQKIFALLKQKTKLKKIFRYFYLKEMRDSKVCISPFGWAELCPRDFEAFMSGSILLKPNMDTFDTWPNWYQNNKTYIPFNWNLSNLIEKLEYTIDNFDSLIDIARTAQKNYYSYLCKNSGPEKFVSKFKKLI